MHRLLGSSVRPHCPNPHGVALNVDFEREFVQPKTDIAQHFTKTLQTSELKDTCVLAMSFFGENFSRLIGSRFSTSNESGNSSTLSYISTLGAFVLALWLRIKTSVKVANSNSPKLANLTAQSHSVGNSADDLAGRC